MSHRRVDEDRRRGRARRALDIKESYQPEAVGAETAFLEGAWEERSDPLDQFADAGFIKDVVRREKSGKEATLYCCRAHAATGHSLLAAKIYEPHAAARYRLRPVYAQGRDRLSRPDGRAQRAIRSKGRYGRAVVFADWIGQEYENLRILYRAGARVPQPVAHSHAGILMEYIGSAAGPAPMLTEVQLASDEAARLYQQAIESIRSFLVEDRIHGDLSAYNMLLRDGHLVIIDLPQMVHARWNDHAFSVLRRDVENVCSFFVRHGVITSESASDVAINLWRQYQRAELAAEA